MKDVTSLMSGYDLRAKIRNSHETTSTLRIMVGGCAKVARETANDKEVNRYIRRLKITIEDTIAKIRQKSYPLNIENFKLMFQTQDNEFSTISTLFDYHEIMEKRISVPVHLLAITSQKTSAQFHTHQIPRFRL